MKKIKKILEELKGELIELYGKKLKELILYGSFARGEETENSDIDLVIVLKGNISPFEEIDRMGEITYDICLKYDILLSTHPISEENYSLANTPFLMNIKEEGVLI